MKNILLIGTGHFGHHIAVQLAQLGHQVMAVDSREDRINEILPFVTSAQIGDATNKEFLRSLGVGKLCGLLCDHRQATSKTLETTSLIKELALPVLSPAQSRMFRPSFCSAMARTMLSIQRSKRPNGPRSATLPIMFLIISSSMSSMRSWTWRYPRPGWGKASAHWISAESLA